MCSPGGNVAPQPPTFTSLQYWPLIGDRRGCCLTFEGKECSFFISTVTQYKNRAAKDIARKRWFDRKGVLRKKKKGGIETCFLKMSFFKILPKLSLKRWEMAILKKDLKQFSAIVFCLVEGDRLLVFHLSSCFKGFLNTRDLVF